MPPAGPGTQIWVKGSPLPSWQALRGGAGVVHLSYTSGVRPGGGLWPGGLLVPLALLLLTLGLWLLPRSLAGLRTTPPC